MRKNIFKNIQARNILFPVILISILSGCSSGQNEIEYTNGALPPEEAIATIKVPPGFQVELVAAEPMVADPVDMTIDEYGNLYVVEMHGYPLDKSGRGKIKMLNDTDGDGKMDQSIVFADGLTWPFGIMRWKKGVIVTDAPHILYLEDSDGDKVADRRDTILTGFAFSNAQMNVGGPVYGLDNWIYLTSEAGGTYQMYHELFGRLGTEIYFLDNRDGRTIPARGSGRTVRFRPDTYEIELTSGSTQFSRTFDIWGHHLLCNNSNHIYHEVIAAPYLKRNKKLVVPYATESLTDHGTKVYSITTNPQKQLLTNEGVFTSACGITAYKGGAFPEPYNQNITFVAEPVSNIIHVDRLKDDKSSFSASRIDTPTKEFMASTDYWFRPVNMYVGPDGSLYVLDYYRQIIEHPEWMSQEAIESGDLYNGVDMGRIYRVSYQGNGSTGSWSGDMSLGNISTTGLLKQLANPNSWWRMNAQRLLIDRRDPSVGPQLKTLIEESPDSLCRVHAMWTLEGLNLIDPDILKRGLNDPVPGVRENAIRIAENHLDEYPELISLLVAMKDDPDPRVRFQLLCTLGYDDSDISTSARYDILIRDMEDSWVQIAALSAASLKQSDLLEGILDEYDGGKVPYNSLITRLSEILAVGGNAEHLTSVLENTIVHIQSGNERGWETSVLDGVAKGLEQNDQAAELIGGQKPDLLNIFLHNDRADIRNSTLNLLSAIGIDGMLDEKATLKSELTAMVRDKNISGERRAEIVKFIGLTKPENFLSFFKELIHPEEAAPVQLAALDALNSLDGIEMSHFVLSHWDKLTPQIRSAAVQAHLSSEEQVNLFLDAIEQGLVQKSSVDFYRRVRYMTYGNDAIKKRARAIFSQEDEGKINAEYEAVLAIHGDKTEGKKVFMKNCAICHQINGKMGTAIGPDLSTVYSWSPEGIMSLVLFPGSSITVGYELWQVELNDGESIQGVIASESPIAITVRNVGMDDQLVKRSSIKSLKSMDYSMMPGGFQEIISVDEMADLIAFLKGR